MGSWSCGPVRVCRKSAEAHEWEPMARAGGRLGATIGSRAPGACGHTDSSQIAGSSLGVSAAKLLASGFGLGLRYGSNDRWSKS